jgi:hypothetical protein
MTDNVNHPPHYNSSPAHCECGRRIECIDVTRHMGFNVGNAVKYLWRYELKNGIEDLKKARWYLDDLINKNDIQNNKTDAMNNTLKQSFICKKEDVHG